jgi:hypothetical protein
MSHEKSSVSGVNQKAELVSNFVLFKFNDSQDKKQEIFTKGRPNNTCPFVSKNETLLKRSLYD